MNLATATLATAINAPWMVAFGAVVIKRVSDRRSRRRFYEIRRAADRARAEVETPAVELSHAAIGRAA